MARFSRRGRRRATGQDRTSASAVLIPADTTFERFRSQLDALVEQVLPYGIDVYTPDFLDQLIESRALQSRAEIWIAHAAEVERMLPDLVLAQADLAYQDVIHRARQRYLAELEAGRDAAVRALLGPEDDSGQGSGESEDG